MENNEEEYILKTRQELISPLGFLEELSNNPFMPEEKESFGDIDTFLTKSPIKFRRERRRSLSPRVEEFEDMIEEMNQSTNKPQGILDDIDSCLNYYKKAQFALDFLKPVKKQKRYKTNETETDGNTKGSTNFFAIKSQFKPFRFKKKKSFETGMKSYFKAIQEKRKKTKKVEKKKNSRYSRLTDKVELYEKENRIQNKFRISKDSSNRTKSHEVSKGNYIKKIEKDNNERRKYEKYVKNKDKARNELFFLIGVDNIYESQKFKTQVDMMKSGILEGEKSSFKLLKKLKLKQKPKKRLANCTTIPEREQKSGFRPRNHTMISRAKSKKNFVSKRNKYARRKSMKRFYTHGKVPGRKKLGGFKI